MYSLIKNLLFLLDPERAHYMAMDSLKLTRQLPGGELLLKLMFNAGEFRPFEWKGLTFRHPVGLAAGFDKDGRYLRELACLGFSFIEAGTVTPLPQPGNAKPRLFRLPKDQGLINRMGFNNRGVVELRSRLLRSRPKGMVIGGNIGKNKLTPNEEAQRDYLTCFEALHDQVDFFTINVSSPNTPGLRELQDKKPLENIITALKSHPLQRENYRPILLKVAPDLTEGQVEDIMEVTLNTGLDGVVATNTTICRDGLKTPADRLKAIGAGGLSGAPLRGSSDRILSQLAKGLRREVLLIGVGGIFGAEDVRRKLDLGAHLVQVYTGFVYEGPTLVKRMIKELKSNGKN